MGTFYPYSEIQKLFFPLTPWELSFTVDTSSYRGDGCSGQVHYKCFVQQFQIIFLGNDAVRWSSLCSYRFKGALHFIPCLKLLCKWACACCSCSSSGCLYSPAPAMRPLLWAAGLGKGQSTALLKTASTSQKGGNIRGGWEEDGEGNAVLPGCLKYHSWRCHCGHSALEVPEVAVGNSSTKNRLNQCFAARVALRTH